MKCNLLKFFLVLVILSAGMQVRSQTATFASLNGNGPTMNTAGWTLLGSANNGGGVPNLLDTNGDPDVFANELILAPQQSLTAGGVFFNGFMDMSANCNFWIADFDLRMFDGNVEGAAFIVSSAIPASTPAISGGLLGMPAGGFTGFSVCFDGYNNCGGASPQLEIRYNTTDECSGGPTLLLAGLISDNYNNIRVVYDKGNIQVFFNGSATPTLTGFYNLNFPAYFGFTAANGGGGTALYSIKNANIYVPIPQVNAGLLQSGCEGSLVNLGSPSLPYYSYSWTPSTGLNYDTISNPVLTIVNNGVLADTFDYITTATIGTCNVFDTVSVWAIPYPAIPVISGPTNAICQGQSATLIISPQGNEAFSWYDVPVGGVALTRPGAILRR